MVTTKNAEVDFMALDESDFKILLMLMKKSIEFSRLGFADQKVLSWFLTHSPHRVKSWVDYLAEDYTSSRATPIDGIKLYDELSICYNEEPFF